MGVIVSIVAGMIIALNWPGEEVVLASCGSFSDCENTVKETGSIPLVLAGSALAAAGNFMLLVAVVAMGVQLGNQASVPVDA